MLKRKSRKTFCVSLAIFDKAAVASTWRKHDLHKTLGRESLSEIWKEKIQGIVNAKTNNCAS